MIKLDSKPFQRRLIIACDTLRILACHEDLDSGNINRLFMMCVDRGVSASWLLHNKGLFWNRHNIICEN